MTRSKFSTKAMLLAGAIGLSMAAFAEQPAAAQEYCPDGLVPDPSYGCTVGDVGNYGYYYGDPYGAYGTVRRWGAPLYHHGFGHGMGGGFADRGVNVSHLGGGGFEGFHGGGFGGGGHR